MPEPAVMTVSVGNGVKVAVTLTEEVSATVQVAALPLQAPPHPEKLEPDAALAVSVIIEPAGNWAVQLAPHEIPAGAEVTPQRYRRTRRPDVMSYGTSTTRSPRRAVPRPPSLGARQDRVPPG